MNISLGPYWEKFIENQLKDGRYGSQSEVVRASLRLMEAHEAKLLELREAVQAGIDDDRWLSADELKASLDQHLDEISGKGD